MWGRSGGLGEVRTMMACIECSWDMFVCVYLVAKGEIDA